MNAVKSIILEVNLALSSTTSEALYLILSQARLLLEPKLSYFLMIMSKSRRMALHPSRIVVSRWVLVSEICSTGSVSSTSLSTACRDKTSYWMLLKLSGASLMDLYIFHASSPTCMQSPTPNPKLIAASLILVNKNV